jgi:hypothetical protein
MGRIGIATSSHARAGTDLALDRLARHYAVTRREVLEKLIGAADKTARQSCVDDAAFEDYLNVTAERLGR